MKRVINIKQIVFVFLLASCIKPTIYELPFEKPQIVINAILKANEIPTVYVGKTWAATGTAPNVYYLDKAVVQIFENNILLGTLSYKNNGLYELKNYFLKVGNVYYFKVNDDVLGRAESKPVIIPEEGNVTKYFFDTKTVMPGIGYSYGNPDAYKARLLTIEIFDAQDKVRYYGIGIKKTKGGYGITGNIYNFDVGNNVLNTTQSDCYQKAWLIDSLNVTLKITQNSPMIIYNNSCFVNKEKKIGIVIETFGTVQDPKLIYAAQADLIEASVCTLSEEYYQFMKYAKIIEGIDNAFFEPIPTYTNIIGGLGVVAALNKKTYIFKI